MRQVTRCDTDAGVGDREHDPAIVTTQLDRHLATAGRVLDRVLDEIERELPDAAAIDRHHQRLGGQMNLDRDPGMLGEQLARLPRLLDDLPNVDGLFVEIRTAFIGARERQQRFEQLRHAIHFLQCLFQRHERFLRQVRSRDGPLDSCSHDGQRGLQLVTRVGCEPP